MFPRFPLFAIFALWAMALSCWGKPTLFIIGDSTVRNSTSGQTGWGDPLVRHFDPAKIGVVNRAIGGRSSRTFLTEGRWDAVMAHLKPGDFVLIQFGHNDVGPLNDDRCRAPLKGIGDQTENIVRSTDHQKETVRTFGWYLKKYVSDTKSKGAVPVLISPIPRNLWSGGKIKRANLDHPLWVKQVAELEHVPFIDFHHLLADAFDALGPEKTAALFDGTDHTHTCAAGAGFNASVMADAIRSLKDCQLAKGLLPADLWLPSVFSDHMILQREMPIPVWGTAIPGSRVSAKLGEQSITTTADAHGCWKQDFPALPAGGPFTLEVTSNEITRTYSDVLVGEVWLCAGQSNMDFTLAPTPKRSFAGVTDWKTEVAAANHPRLRMFTAEWAMSELPQREVAGTWRVCTPENAGDFSAVAYYFGLGLQQNLDVPIGLVTCAYGASTIESWIREESLTSHPQFQGLLKAFGTKRIAFRDNPGAFEDYGKQLAQWKGGRAPKNPDPVQDQHNPFVLHNGMIAPIVPYAIRGAIWYQGESNLNTRNLYADLQQTLIGDWRAQWGNPKLPFYFVQLAPNKAPLEIPGSGQLAEMREVQATTLTIPHTGMAVTLDIGDEADVHPRNKLDVGKRLARLALTETYERAGESSGPVYRESSIQNGRIRVQFDHVGGGLVAKCGTLKQFAIAAADSKFVWADATVDGDSVIVSSPAVADPVFVRYAWAENPAGANLYNSEGLPAAPFRTDP